MRARQNGFTLLELSITLAIIAIVVGISAATGISVIGSARLSATLQKMATIGQALTAYRAANDRLPCPADLTIAPGGTNYGLEGATPGTCTGGTPAANFSAAGTTNAIATAAEGAVPVATLGLPNEFMYDGWGNHFRYAVDISITALGAFTSSPICMATGAITINDANASPRTAGAIYALISHGANGHGAYARSGAIVNAASVNANEQTNCHCNVNGTRTSPTVSYSPTHVQRMPYIDTGNSFDDFDDLVTFKERWQLRTDWDAACSQAYIYIADDNNGAVRMVSPNGLIQTVAGAQTGWGYTGDGGFAINAEIGWTGMARVDSSRNIYWADYYAQVVRKVTYSTGIINRIAGTLDSSGFSGDGGAATSAQFNTPVNVGVDSSGNVYVVDNANNRIRKVAAGTGIITTVAGNGMAAFSGDGGRATSAEINDPGCVSVDSSGNFYITDDDNGRIRKVTVATGVITTVAGNGTGGYSGDGGQATSAELDWPGCVAFDSSGNMYIADSNNNRVRKVTIATGIITTYAGSGPGGYGNGGYSGDGGPATSALMQSVGEIAIDSNNNLYIADWQNNRIRKVTASTGIITAVAGNGTAGFSGDGGQATSAELNEPQGVSVYSSR